MSEKNDTSIFSEEEILSIREGKDGIKHVLPPRFYTDQSIYQLEVERILKRNWLFIGRWDQAENPGDYFTINMWGQSIIIVRNNEGKLNALVNVCQHRFSQVVDDGSGNTKFFRCPYHRWTYDLDGRLKGITTQPIPGFDKKQCRLPSLRVEEWQGFIFVNYDQDALPLGQQLEGLNKLFDNFQLDTFRQQGEISYKSRWNYKCSFENGFEGYHHVGLHHDAIHHLIPSSNTKPYLFGEIYGSYTMWPAEDLADEIKKELEQPFGVPPWAGNGDKDVFGDYFVGIYPAGPMMFLQNFQCTYLITHHQGVDSNYGITGQTFPPWVIDSPGAKEKIEAQVEMMKHIQDEDSYGCDMWQKGLKSANGSSGLLHPLEVQINHFHNWYIDQMMNTEFI